MSYMFWRLTCSLPILTVVGTTFRLPVSLPAIAAAESSPWLAGHAACGQLGGCAELGRAAGLGSCVEPAGAAGLGGCAELGSAAGLGGCAPLDDRGGGAAGAEGGGGSGSVANRAPILASSSVSILEESLPVFHIETIETGAPTTAATCCIVVPLACK